MAAADSLIQILKSNSQSLTHFLSELNDALVRDVNSSGRKQTETQNVFDNIYLLNELEKIRCDSNLELSVNRSFDTVVVKCFDDFMKGHHLIVRMDKDRKFQIIQHSLPDMNVLNMRFADLKLALDTFHKCIFDIQDYFEAMDDIDDNCWIIDPIQPTHKQNYRRVMIDKDVSVLITVDVSCANKPPNVKLLGTSKLTDPFYMRIQENIDKWNDEDSFILNLLSLFGLSKFPEKEIVDDTKTAETECCICFTGRDEQGMLPSVKCERPMCLQNYHTKCLYQWLAALSGNVKFNTIHGECPSCSFSISCAVVNCDS